MKLLEQYEEVIERDPRDISYCWKASIVFAYLLGSLSSYACAIVFHIFWHEACGGHCFFWADAYLQPVYRPNKVFPYDTMNDSNDSWTQDILIGNERHLYCKWIHFVLLLSCFASITSLIMFSICGKGGHDLSLFVAPWRIVIPALISNSFMMILTMTAANLFTSGYSYFTDELYQLAYEIMQSKQSPFNYELPCEVFQTFAKTYNKDDRNFCGMYTMTQIFMWTMSWSWTGSVIILCLRILMSIDFSLLEVKIYEKPKEKTKCQILQATATSSDESSTRKQKVMKVLGALKLKRK